MSVIRSGFRHLGLVVALSGGAILISACDGGGDIRSQLGVSRRSPDEFSVVTNAPLALPPDFSLRPPQPGAPPTQGARPETSASTAVFGATLPGGPAAGTPVGVAAAQPPSALEQQFLSRAGATSADPAIRATLNQESGALVEKSRNFAREVLGIANIDPTDIVVNAPEEARRLRQNAASGLPASTGDTPQIRRGNPGLLEGVF
ncbi:DUF3035 domain-containing protein [Zavarzinia compransoris]|nr:DUF3035 domain-containing protein [Zavarzinia compransoris]TDP47768.1 beta-barrel assembly complex subunit BamF [Zavarzinia compransoris]